MKSIFNTCVIFFLLFSGAYSQIQRFNGQKISGNKNWSGTIVIAGDVTVEPKGRLIIEPGTKVLFEANKDISKSGSDKTRSELIVRGTLIARGLPGKKITFTSKAAAPRMGDWYGIEFLHLKSGSIVDYCVIEFANTGITIKNSIMQVNNSEIRYNYNAGIRAEVKAKPIIKNNILSENGYAGLICELGAKPILTNNLISLNRIGVVVFSLSQPNLGSIAPDDNHNPGRNRIFNNEEYNFYNHSNKPILAENNSWGDQSIAAIGQKLYDNDDNSKYGSIDYVPFLRESVQSNLGNMLLLAQNTPQGSAVVRKVNQQKNPESQVRNQVLSVESGEIIPDSITQFTEVQDLSIVGDEDSGKIDLSNRLEDATPMIASTSPSETAVNELPVSNKTVANQIDYNQTFLELFLDRGKKEYINKPKLRITKVLRNVLRKGEVRIKVIVSKSGDVESATILRGINEILDQAVLATVQKYKYQAGTVNGQPVNFSTSEVFRFE